MSCLVGQYREVYHELAANSQPRSTRSSTCAESRYVHGSGGGRGAAGTISASPTISDRLLEALPSLAKTHGRVGAADWCRTRRIVGAALVGGGSEKMAPLCAEFGISRKTGYKIYDRYKSSGAQAFSDRSRRPYRQANRLPARLKRRSSV
jgi:hypothetical protein